MTDIILFAEDVLIELAARKIIASKNANLNITTVMGKRGFGYCASRAPAILRSSQALRFMIFLDGDELGDTCPSDAIESWFGSKTPNNIHVRVAFYEVESWLLADKRNLAQFLQIPENVIPNVRDDTRNTKEVLLQLARRSRSRQIVEDLTPPDGYTAKVGPAYITRMSDFIQNSWDIGTAEEFNDSLARACRKVASLG